MDTWDAADRLRNRLRNARLIRCLERGEPVRVPDLAGATGYSAGTLYKLIREGHLSAVRVGQRQWRVTAADAAALLERLYPPEL